MGFIYIITQVHWCSQWGVYPILPRQWIKKINLLVRSSSTMKPNSWLFKWVCCFKPNPQADWIPCPKNSNKQLTKIFVEIHPLKPIVLLLKSTSFLGSRTLFPFADHLQKGPTSPQRGLGGCPKMIPQNGWFRISWLVVQKPSWKLWVNGKDDIPFLWWTITFMFETANQFIIYTPIKICWCFGTSFFPHIGNVIIPTDDLIFFRGRYTTNQKMYDTLWLCQNSYWKLPFIVSFPIKNGDFP